MDDTRIAYNRFPVVLDSLMSFAALSVLIATILLTLLLLLLLLFNARSPLIFGPLNRGQSSPSGIDFDRLINHVTTVVQSNKTCRFGGPTR